MWAADEHTHEQFGYGNIERLLPLPKELRERGEALSDWFQGSLNWEYPPFPGPWWQEECDHFRVAVHAFYHEIQTTLGEEFILIYEQSEPDEDPDLDRYIEDPQNFRRKEN